MRSPLPGLLYGHGEPMVPGVRGLSCDTRECHRADGRRNSRSRGCVVRGKTASFNYNPQKRFVMGTIKQRLLGLVSVAFLLGVVPMVMPLGSEAQAGPSGRTFGRSEYGDD